MVADLDWPETSARLVRTGASRDAAPLLPVLAGTVPAQPRSELWLDISRMLWRVHRGTLSGVDRVELAYAEHLLARCGERLRFVAHDYRGGFALLPQALTESLVRRVGPAWRDGTLRRLSPLALALFAGSLAAWRRPPGGASRGVIYLNVSHHPLHRGTAVQRLVRRSGARFVPLIHDLIPLDWPEYVSPAETLRHARRLDTVRTLADGVIANSEATAVELRRHLPRTLPVLAAPLGVAPVCPAPLPPQVADGRPFFLVVGTIVARKNHLLLLHLWRRLAAAGGAVPRLVIVGSRGPRNPQVHDLLERCAVLRPHLLELGAVSDSVVAGLACAARAVLVPSFAEGFSLPVAEALALGAPVLASDIPAHREVGRDVPEYLDACDLPGWQAMVADYARPGSMRRARQLAALRSWAGQDWTRHMDDVLSFLAAIEVGGSALVQQQALSAQDEAPGVYVSHVRE
ncbi:glycosyltransferase family 4 protein [Falsiroseomonas sp.]|uniref:glycosyltransferase family 4 protein n=1 Tax=Falsiroseomonas sp. TaxID=2870721 RepID=UPI003565865B